MRSIPSSYSMFSGFGKYRMRTILIIAVFWTLIDIVAVQLFKDTTVRSPFKSGLLREAAVFIMSCVMGYLFVFTLKNVFRKKSAFTNFIFKSIILLIAAFIINFIVHFVDSVLIMGNGTDEALETSLNEIVHIKLLLQRIIYWMILFVVTQLYIEINEKYSPGVFMDIITGKYMQPKIENRIIMFIDLKDSTPIAEKLGHVENFKFIRDFIFYISSGFLENDGRIYQYVGDEIVVWWPESKVNARKAFNSLLSARKELNKHMNRFKRGYDTFPEYKAGIHTGMVTVGQVGIVKKDLVMSGDAINTAARIRTSCTELNHKYIASKDFIDLLDIEEWQVEALGPIEMKGKNQGVELFALKI